MEIEDLFEQWDDVDQEGLESFLTEENGADEVDEEVIEEIDRSDGSSDCEDDDHVAFKVIPYNSRYKKKMAPRTEFWVDRHV